jgi:hypothetical protein
MSENVYYSPEDSGLVPIDQLDEPNLSYEYNILIALQHTDSGRCYYVQDSGCSCPVPFDNFFFRGPDDTNLDEVQLHNFSSFEAEVKSFATGSYRDENGIAQHERDKMLDTVKAALKKAKVTHG